MAHGLRLKADQGEVPSRPGDIRSNDPYWRDGRGELSCVQKKNLPHAGGKLEKVYA